MASFRPIKIAIVFLALISLLVPATAMAKPRPENVFTVEDRIRTQGPVSRSGLGKAATDTVYILGGANRQDGRFQDDENPFIPDDEGWVTAQEWAAATDRWNIDTFNAASLDSAQPDNHAMWCGAYYPNCDEGPDHPGYGNNWNSSLLWIGNAPVPWDSTQVTVAARLNYDIEPGYDWLYLEVMMGGVWTPLLEFTHTNQVAGEFVPVDILETFWLDPGDYVDSQIHIRWRFVSDAGWSDEDCRFDTEGAAQIDNIAVVFDQGTGPVIQTYDDFEDPQAVNWVSVAEGCGTGRVWAQLPDAGLHDSNLTPQLAFIDDGLACGSDGTPGVKWTYGPGGYIIQCDPDDLPFWQQMYSPPLTLPVDAGDYDGVLLEFDLYGHAENFTPNFSWAVRTSSSGGQSWSPWKSHGFLYEMGKPEYSREYFFVDPSILDGADTIQISLGVYIFQTWSGGVCSNTSPAPYFDNVSLKVFDRDGPFLISSTTDARYQMLQDAFPTNGGLDLQILGSNSVSVLSSNQEPVRIYANPRDDAQLTGPPELHWKLRRNPLFDPYRLADPPNPVLGDSVGATFSGDPRQGTVYSFTFPDSGWFYPGDILHYYFTAQDDRPDGTGMALLPPDTSGFSFFAGDEGFSRDPYPRYFVVRALPTLTDTIPGAQPGILVFQDDYYTDDDDAWFYALAKLGLLPGRDYDLYQNTNPNFPLRGTAAQFAGYETLLYNAGRWHRSTLTDEDVVTLNGWIAQGDKNLLLMGDSLADDLDYPGDTNFLHHTMGVFFDNPQTDADVRPHIDDQAVPLVLPLPGNPVGLTTQFRINSMYHYNDFDAISAFDTGQPLAEFAAPDGQPGGYAFDAAVYNYLPVDDTHLITMPFGINVVEAPSGGGALNTQSALLGEILGFFGNPTGVGIADVPAARELSVSSYPNPFNPSTTIAYSMPAAGHMQIKIYDLRGREVRTLRDERAAAGRGEVVWDGTDARGSAVSSGVYFCRVVAGDQERLLKLSLIK